MGGPARHFQDNPALGVGLLLLALFLLSAMDAVAKYLTFALEPPQILAVRFSIFLMFALAMAKRAGLRRSAKSARPGVQTVRGLVMVCQMTAFLVAISFLPLADVHAIVALAPLLVMAMAAIFLGERIGPRRIVAVAVGFVGVMIIIRPGTGVFEPASLIALAGACFWSVFQVLLRVVGASDGPETTTLYSAVIGAICFGALAPFFWRPPDAETWAWLVVLGLLGAVGHFLLSMAFQKAPASTLQPFAYSMPIWAALMGWAAFGEFPDQWTIVGGAIVIASGLYALGRERKAATESSPGS